MKAFADEFAAVETRLDTTGKSRHSSAAGRLASALTADSSCGQLAKLCRLAWSMMLKSLDPPQAALRPATAAMMLRALGLMMGLALALPASAQVPAGEKPAPATEPAKTVTPNDAQNSMCLVLESAARANNLPVEFFARVIWQESRFRADAEGPVTRSGQRAQGIAQFMPGTAAERNLLDPFDPIQALSKSAEFLRDLRSQFGNLGLAAAAYNAGPRRVREWMQGIGAMPAKTRAYVQAITGVAIEQWATSGAADKSAPGGPACGELMALLKHAPNPFVAALEQHIVAGSAQPWSVILTAGFSRTRILGSYAELERRHTEALAGRDAYITQTRLYSRGPIPFYQVRVGVPDRNAAYDVCNRIRRAHGACVIMRNPRAS